MKDPEKRTHLACLRNNNEVGMPERERARKGAVGNEGGTSVFIVREVGRQCRVLSREATWIFNMAVVLKIN